MPRPLPQFHLILAVLVCLPTAAYDQAEKDPIASAVRQAEEGFLASVAEGKRELSKQLTFIMEREIQRAITKGDLDELESLQAQLEAFRSDGTYPSVPATRSHILTYRKKQVRSGDVLVKAYDTAVRRYTQERDVDSARLVQEKIKWTRPTTGLDTVERRGSHYLLVREKVSWNAAKEECETLGGYLVCFNSKSEHRFVFEQLTKGKNIIAWVGATDAHKEGDWIWLDGTNNYWLWNKKEPNNVRGGQHYGTLNKEGSMSDSFLNDKLANAYICEWDYLPTRETIYQTEESRKQESAEIETLKTATLEHNERIVQERAQLQSAILEAQDDSQIAEANTTYNARVRSIKQDYTQQLRGVLATAIEGDRLETAGKIKTQLLRVERQIARLKKQDTPTDVPALDNGGSDTRPQPKPPIDADSDSHIPALDEDDPEEADDPGGFFGLPLE